MILSSVAHVIRLCPVLVGSHVGNIAVSGLIQAHYSEIVHIYIKVLFRFLGVAPPGPVFRYGIINNSPLKRAPYLYPINILGIFIGNYRAGKFYYIGSGGWLWIKAYNLMADIKVRFRVAGVNQPAWINVFKPNHVSLVQAYLSRYRPRILHPPQKPSFKGQPVKSIFRYEWDMKLFRIPAKQHADFLNGIIDGIADRSQISVIIGKNIRAVYILTDQP